MLWRIGTQEMYRNRYFWHAMKAPFTLIISLVGIFTAATVQAVTLSVTVDSDCPFHKGDSEILVSIRTDEEITVGSTDITLNWDQPGLAVDSVSSSVLSGFAYNIDNGNQQVSTASASSGGDVIPTGTILMTVSFSALELGTYSLFITDGDGAAPDDLAGPVPPIPPPAILYTQVPDNLVVSPQPGDLNGDGNVDAGDVLLLMRQVLGN